MQSKALRDCFNRATRLRHGLVRRFCQGTVVATHNGVFHCDEVMACSLLTRHVSKFRGAKIIRSRDPGVIERADVVVDVGGTFDYTKGRFDHHQRSFQETFSSSHQIKLSSAGLIYKHYGKECIESGIETLRNTGRMPSTLFAKLDDSWKEKIWLQLYNSFFSSLDAIDNGVNLVPLETPKAFDYYKTDLASRVARLNLPWWEESCEKKNMKLFENAMEICEDEYLSQLQAIVMTTIGSEDVIERDLLSSTVNEGRILILTQYCAWKQALLNVEERLSMLGRTQFVVYKDRWSDGWRVQAVPIEKGSFTSRKLLHNAWRGLPKAELVQKSGIKDVNFVHSSGFIGGSASKESSIRMAELSLLS